MLHGKFTIIVTCMLVLVVAASTLVLAEIDSTSADYFGIKDIKEPYKTRITQVLQLASQQNHAILASGFKVYTLTDIIKDDYKKYYIWTDSAGMRIKTTHFLGTDEIFMNEGDLYIGIKTAIWLIVYRNGREVKFSVEF